LIITGNCGITVTFFLRINHSLVMLDVAVKRVLVGGKLMRNSVYDEILDVATALDV